MNTKLFLAILLTGFTHGAYACYSNAGIPDVEKNYVVDRDTIPTFEGGGICELSDKQMKWMLKHRKYPKKAEEENIEGTVIIGFEVDGSITNVRVIRSAHPLLDEEAVGVVCLMPKFKPFMMDGKPVRQKLSTPIRFKLQ